MKKKAKPAGPEAPKLKICVVCRGTGVLRSLPKFGGRHRKVVETECYQCGGTKLRNGHGR